RSLLGPVGAMKDAPEYPAGDPAFQIDPVAEAERTGEPDPAGGRRDVVRAQLLQLGGEHALQPARAGREEGMARVGGSCHCVFTCAIIRLWTSAAIAGRRSRGKVRPATLCPVSWALSV